MATLKPKISDFFDPFSNPAGGANFAISKTTPQMILNGPAPVAPSASPVAPPITNQNLLPASLRGGATSPSSSPLFSPSSAGPSSAPIGPTGATGAAPASQAPAHWLKADGTFKTPEEIAADVGTAIKTAHGNGDVGTLALEQFGGNKSAADLAAEARRIGNTRNDISVGETDPYKVASQSGIAYTPGELSAIEKAYAGIYDPALDTALSKVQSKQDAEKTANQPFTLGKDEVRYGADGKPIAVGISSSTGAGGTYSKGSNPTIDAYVQGRLDGTYKPSDIPDAYKDLVAQGVSQTAPTISKASNDAISNIDNLLNSGVLEKITGLSTTNPLIFLPGSSEAPLLNIAKQLKGILSLENRQQLKGSGAISDFEFRVLGDAASALGIQENGTSNLGEADFKKELEKLKLKLQVGETSLTDQDLVDLRDKGYTPEQIRDYSQSLKGSVGNTTASKTALNRPQRNNNPGNVKSGGLADTLAVGKDEQGHLIFPDAQTGFRALTADLTAKVNGASSRLPANPTIAQLGKVYAEDPNWPVKVAAILGVPVDTHTQTIPIDKLAQAVAHQEGFYS